MYTQSVLVFLLCFGGINMEINNQEFWEESWLSHIFPWDIGTYFYSSPNKLQVWGIFGYVLDLSAKFIITLRRPMCPKDHSKQLQYLAQGPCTITSRNSEEEKEHMLQDGSGVSVHLGYRQPGKAKGIILADRQSVPMISLSGRGRYGLC